LTLVNQSLNIMVVGSQSNFRHKDKPFLLSMPQFG